MASLLLLRSRYEHGEYREVYAEARRALAVFGSREHSDPSTVQVVAGFEELAALAALELGLPEEALELIEAAVNHTRRSTGGVTLARAVINRGVILEKLGRLASAQDDYLEATRMLSFSLDPLAADLSATVADYLADLRNKRDEPRPSAEASNSGAETAARSVTALNSRGLEALNSGDPQLAIELFEEALGAGSRFVPPKLTGIVTCNLSQAYEALGQPDVAKTHLTAAIEIHRRNAAYDELAIDLMNLASIEGQLGDVGAAARCYKEAWDAVRTGNPKSPTALRVLRALAAVRLEQGDRPRARAACERALELYDEMRPELARTEGEHQGPLRIVRELVEVLLHLALDENWMDELAATMEHGKARFWLDALGHSEPVRSDALGPDRVRATGFLVRLADAVGPDVLVLMLYAGEHALFSVRIFNGHVTARRRNLIGVELSDMVDEFRYELQASDANASHVYGERLAGELLGNRPMPERPRAVIIMPDGPLWAAPFDALGVPAWNGDVLAARCPVSICPSLQALEHFQRREQRAQGHWRPLVVGDPGAGEPIPGTLHQMTAIKGAIAARARGGWSFEGQTATYENLLRFMDKATHVHIATHATASFEDPEPRLALFAAAGQPAYLRARDIEALNLQADLVFLAACSTTLGVESAGEGMMSLARSFLFAGARCVVGALWPIPDEQMITLVKQFYTALATGSTIAEALHDARMGAKDMGVRPRTWSALQLMGDGDSRTELRMDEANA
jgi:tetratricopeptide (TPR) repeat protein